MNVDKGRVESVEAGPLRAGSSNMSRAPLVVLLVAKADERIAEVVQQDAESKLQLRRLENVRASVEHLLEPEREPVPAEKVALAG